MCVELDDGGGAAHPVGGGGEALVCVQSRVWWVDGAGTARCGNWRRLGDMCRDR